MIKVNIPSAMRTYANGDREAQFSAATIDALIDAIIEKYPELRPHLLDETGNVLSFVNVFVNDENIRDLAGSDTALHDRDEVFLVPAMAGG